MMNLLRLGHTRNIKNCLVAVALVSGCTTPVTPDFSAMSASYSNILEQYQLNSILINIIRASKERPLSFLDIPSINGSGNVTTTPGLSGSLVGFAGGTGGVAGITSLTPSLNLSFGNSFNFSQSSLDNATFLRGFLSQIPIETAKFFISDNLPREVMFSLVISSIEVRRPNGTSAKYINNPLLPEHTAFQAELYKLLSYGLTIDKVQEPPTKPIVQLPKGMVPPPTGMPNLPPISNPYPGFPNPSGLGSPFGMTNQTQPTTQYKFCVDENKFINFVKEEFSPGIFCRTSKVTVPTDSSKAELILTIRSTNNIFEYLGQVVAAQNAPNPYLVTLPPLATTPVRKVGELNQYALLVVNKNLSENTNFATVKTLDGDTYSIPSMNNGYSPMVIKIISQLLSLNKIPGSIPTSPGILLR